MNDPVGNMLGKKTVLIIDDDELLSGALRALIQREGFEVICCGNGLDALDLTKGKCINVIITDYNMPGMDGVEVTRALRGQCPAAFIIGLTSAPKEEEFRSAGADAFFNKPFSIKEVIEAVSGQLRSL